MPEPPDFDQIATRIARSVPGLTAVAMGNLHAEIAFELRQVWNARGAADCAILDSYGYAKHLGSELRTLDR